MPTSDSEDFESADEGLEDVNTTKKGRKKRHSSTRSSNYSDCPQDSDTEMNRAIKSSTKPVQKVVDTNEGWDDFGIDDSEKPKTSESKGKQLKQNTTKETPITKKEDTKIPDSKEKDGWDDFEIEDDQISSTKPEPKENFKTLSKVSEPELEVDSEQNKGWDDFNDWGNDDVINSNPKSKEIDKTIKGTNENPESELKNNNKQDKEWSDFDDWGDDNIINNDSSNVKADIPQSQDIKSLADRLSAASGNESKPKFGWGWGGGSWGVDTLLSSATAGISSITNHVSQSISTVLETSIGAPDPAELARRNKLSAEIPSSDKELSPAHVKLTKVKEDEVPGIEDKKQLDDGAFQLGSLLSGVTKFVENTGTKVIAGGLGTLETIGKKTMEVLQEGDPGLAKKRAMLGLDSGENIVLSQVLREAKSRADEEDRVREEKREAKQVHYETLFDDFEGLVHLEALEMLSKQVTMRIEEQLRHSDLEKRQEIKETLQQVAELCEMPDEDDDDCDSSGTPEAFQERLEEATQDVGLKLQFEPLVKQYREVIDWLSNEEQHTGKSVYKRAVSALAESTALCVELYHKTGEMLLVKTRRSTADEADALTQLTVVLTRHVSDLATKFTEKLNALPAENKEQLNTYITNVFLEAGNSSSYIQNAFQLELPILQIGAA